MARLAAEVVVTGLTFHGPQCAAPYLHICSQPTCMVCRSARWALILDLDVKVRVNDSQ
jgi:hypothetical protein